MVQLLLRFVVGLLELLGSNLQLLPLLEEDFVLMASGAVVGEAGREQLVHGLTHHTLPLLWVASERSEAKLQVHALA